MRGFPIQKALLALADSKRLEMICSHILINANAHWILIHTALRNVFSLCPPPDTNRQWVEWKKKMRASQSPADADRKAMLVHAVDDVQGTEVLQAQYVLYNWLSSYLRAPEITEGEGKNELPYMTDALPYYWLGQVSLMAIQEGMPPFKRDKPTDPTEHFRVVKHWLRHVRHFLRKSGNKQPTLLWNEMMKIRLQSGTGGAVDDEEGLLGLFPDGVRDFWGPLQYQFGA
jgi:hypothetical protein